MTPRIQAKATHRFSAAAERVFDAWLDEDVVREWMSAALRTMGLPGEMTTVRLDARVGGSFLFADIRDGVEARHWGTYIELERPHRLVFTWIVDASEEDDPSTVTVTIMPDGEGSVATVVHDMDAAWAEYVKRTEDGWTRMMGAIEATLLT